METLGDVLTDFISKHNITASQVSKDLGVDSHTVNYWLSGEHLPSRRSCYKIATYIEVDPSYIENIVSAQSERRDVHTIDNSLNRFILKWLEDNNLNFTEGQKILRLGHDRIDDWLINGYRPSVEVIPKVSEILGMHPTELGILCVDSDKHLQCISALGYLLRVCRYALGVPTGMIKSTFGVCLSTWFNWEVKTTHVNHRSVELLQSLTGLSEERLLTLAYSVDTKSISNNIYMIAYDNLKRKVS